MSIFLKKKNPPEPFFKCRAWTEVSLQAIEKNASEFKRILPSGCELMAVVKAEAYGHGAVRTALSLERSGVKAFATATLKEAIELRKSGVKGDILVLGYTYPYDAGCLEYYNIIQTITDWNYAARLNESGFKINAHIKLDTGMHRLGFDWEDIESIKKVYSLENISVKGIYSHLCACDSGKKEDVEYTELQLERFFKVVEELKRSGMDTGKIHVQSTYGVLNYRNLNCGFARIGIGLYGTANIGGNFSKGIDLAPALSLKARVEEVRYLSSGESIGYGREYTASKNMKIAIVSVGYGDGIPSSYTGEGAFLLIKGKKAPIIGRICMDSLTADVTDIEGVESGMAVTLIGREGTEEIKCEDVARKCGTIPNEILSRLGERLERVYIQGKNVS